MWVSRHMQLVCTTQRWLPPPACAVALGHRTSVFLSACEHGHRSHTPHHTSVRPHVTVLLWGQYVPPHRGTGRRPPTEAHAFVGACGGGGALRVVRAVGRETNRDPVDGVPKGSGQVWAKRDMLTAAWGGRGGGGRAGSSVFRCRRDAEGCGGRMRAASQATAGQACCGVDLARVGVRTSEMFVRTHMEHQVRCRTAAHTIPRSLWYQVSP